MTSPLKSKLLNEFKLKLDFLNTRYMKNTKNSNRFHTQDRLEFETYINSEEAIHMISKPKELDHLLSSHFLAFYEGRDQIISFSLDFPDEFSTYEELKEKTDIYIFSQDKYSRKNDYNSASFSFNSFEIAFENYSYFINYFYKYNLFDHSQDSPLMQKTKTFNNLFFKDKAKTILFVDRFRKNEDLFNDAFQKKVAFITKRRELNRSTKENKKKNKGRIKSEIEDNNSEIRALRRKIQELENANKNLKSSGYSSATYISDEKSKLGNLKKYYVDSINLNLSREFKVKTNENHLELFEQMIQI